ncbi:MAG: hypothetical protein HY791_11430 [Deltaproteobacteria bacterium]|nr:hypothetical protein [Deltaproteobacteria bacterium]
MEQDRTEQQKEQPETLEQERLPYEPPRVTKKREVARVTLFSGSGVSGPALTGPG